MEIFDLKVVRREEKGKKLARRIRRGDAVPGVIYSHGKETIALTVPRKDLYQLIHKHADENVIVNVIIDENTNQTALINEIQLHPLNDEILHVDFKGVSMDEKITVRVAIHAVGESVGVKQGGILDHAHREVTVECLPMNIPEHIDVNIENLGMAKSIYVRDIQFPEGVECLDEPELVLLTVVPPKAEEAATPAVEEGTAPTEPEVIKKGKEEKEEEAEA